MNSRSRSRREESFERLYEACYHDITAYVARRTTAIDVGDVVAKVFAVAWRRLERVPEPPDDRLWLFGVARRCLSDHRRSDNRQLRLRARLAREPDFGPNAIHSVDADPRLELVVSAMASLASNDREALRLVLWEGLTHGQAAMVLNCTVNAFEIRYRRARNAVKDAVEKATASSLATTTPINKPDTPKGVPQ
ncbi:MAG: RNA polymerase sigma factor [Acidimicrobiales bacterium]